MTDWDEGEQHGPPGGGLAQLPTSSINMALLTEGSRISARLRSLALEAEQLTLPKKMPACLSSEAGILEKRKSQKEDSAAMLPGDSQAPRLPKTPYSAPSFAQPPA
jgi:hypothetical protein